MLAVSVANFAQCFFKLQPTPRRRRKKRAGTAVAACADCVLWLHALTVPHQCHISVLAVQALSGSMP
jgi:hypothetical protein